MKCQNSINSLRNILKMHNEEYKYSHDEEVSNEHLDYLEVLVRSIMEDVESDMMNDVGLGMGDIDCPLF